MQIPTIGKVGTQLSGAAFFSMLDYQAGFHQIPIDEKSNVIDFFYSVLEVLL